MFYHLLYPLHTAFAGFNVFRYITLRSIGAAVCAFLLVLFLGPLFIRTMQRLQIGQVVREDGPETHFKKKGVPTMGGLLILLSVTVSTLLWARLDNPLIWLVLLVTLFFGMIGAYDDYKKISKKTSEGLSAKGKLLLQIAGALIVGFFVYLHPGYDGQLSIPFMKNVQPDLGWFYIVFAVIVIVGASNAVNLTDGLDGLAAGPMVVSSAVYLLFAYLAGNVVLANYLHIPYVAGSGELAIFCGTLFGACLGFLWFNAHPAQMFMGDVGSLALGGALGSIAIIIKQEFLLAIVGGVFVMEALSVMLQVGYFRMSKGKRIFLMAPFHHHFEKKGWSEPKVVVRFWIVSIILGLFAIATLKLR
ncbi:phospho-N-acetylmuramoyl-pentapeptide-transferase [Desulfotalea psychrophila]|uniref:Phospho-N-acetylmuramoyl-pentapeptide-transferase n=1 Tax=Desulfotalea psychrophila (strain LSv54 / DSM 12343) TaxID=177439 RepID=MRAY_DESPS|nr:phospho-N-acetylmuramoyl-pentapeptide-transferase [Desulfotalea psychrophila]Q6AJ51.1 RecName: Full=Phospho-N-acetylmuramoyl-pentapeptide-transferase; AltName: Full=UDP-MurNAc-pentapeptide phosphotransferase [Desulfotalea psychrophila LSv54]CAG37629.1 probable phospho-N-acetylmuramoyl-pentapeptide-transferase [Desulfotalea psychrophila LSv54]